MRDETSFTLPPFEEADHSGIKIGTETEEDGEANSEIASDEDSD
jgi:hypothetical protein